MKRFLTAAVLVLALVATLGSASDEDGESGSSPTTVGSSDGSESEGGETTAADGGSSEAGEADEVDDVTITACGEKDELNFTTATIEVVNNSSGASNYLIEVAFESADGSSQLATGNAFITSLGPDQSKVEEINSLTEIAEEGVTCRLTSVDRLSA